MWILLATLGCRPAGPPARPNLVLVVIDTLRADHLVTYGYDRPVGTRLDALASKAAVFEQATSHAPWTKPSVATMLTSLEPLRHGISDWDRRLDVQLPTIQSTLGAAGYATHAIVAHHAFDPESNEFHVGWQTFDVSVWKGKKSPHVLSTSAEVTDLALAALGSLPEPFVLFVHYFDPHEYYLPHPDFVFGDRPVDLYDGEIAYTDAHLGRLLDRVVGRPDTYVAVVADHGEEFLDHGAMGHTRTLYEEALHVPLLMWGPTIAPQRIPGRFRLVDLAPTLFGLIGQAPSPGFEGTAWTLTGGRFEDRDDEVFSETRRLTDLRSLIAQGMKAIWDPRDDSVHLYDLRRDPGEHRDLAASQPARAAAMVRRMRQHDRATRIAPRVPMTDDEVEILEALGYAEDPAQSSQQ